MLTAQDSLRSLRGEAFQVCRIDALRMRLKLAITKNLDISCIRLAALIACPTTAPLA
jgi:hypothetical protein